MKKERKMYLLRQIDAEIKRRLQYVEGAKEVTNSFISASPSESGDRLLYRLLYQLADNALKKLIHLKNEIESSSNDTATIIAPPCYVEVRFPEGEVESFYLVNNVVNIDSINFVSPKSPLGKALLGRCQGETVTYSVAQGKQISVIIEKVE